MLRAQKQLIAIFSFIILVIILGTLGFYFFEGLSLLDSIYFTICTVTTVGYGDIVPENNLGKLLSLFIIVFGVSGVLMILGVWTTYVVKMGIRESLGFHTAFKPKNHIIICRYNEYTKELLNEISAHKGRYLIIENDESRLNEIKEKEIPFLSGNPSDEKVLVKAGIEKAKEIILVSKDDSENVFIGMGARGLNPDVMIIGLLNNKENRRLFERIKVDRIVDPHELTIDIMIRSTISPYVGEFLDSTTLAKGIRLAQYKVTSPLLISKKIGDLNFRDRTGATIVAIWDEDKFIPNPEPDTLLKKDSILVMLGDSTQLKQAKMFIKGRSPRNRPFGDW